MNLLRALSLFVAIGVMSHCTRVDSTVASYGVTYWRAPGGSLCARVVPSSDKKKWQAAPRMDPPKTFDTQAAAIAWIESTYCFVDAK